jgi:hypothetical protein
MFTMNKKFIKERSYSMSEAKNSMPRSSQTSPRSETRMSMSSPSFNSKGYISNGGNKGRSGCLIAIIIFVVVGIIIGIISLIKWLF